MMTKSWNLGIWWTKKLKWIGLYSSATKDVFVLYFNTERSENYLKKNKNSVQTVTKLN